MKSLTDFVTEAGITVSVKKIRPPQNGNTTQAQKEKRAGVWSWKNEATQWRVTFRRASGESNPWVISFWTGAAITDVPTAEDVLDCLASDASGYENARTFEEWASEYGYDVDSRKAEKIYNDVKRQTDALKRFLNDLQYNQLLWETERL